MYTGCQSLDYVYRLSVTGLCIQVVSHWQLCIQVVNHWTMYTGQSLDYVYRSVNGLCIQVNHWTCIQVNHWTMYTGCQTLDYVYRSSVWQPVYIVNHWTMYTGCQSLDYVYICQVVNWTDLYTGCQSLDYVYRLSVTDNYVYIVQWLTCIHSPVSDNLYT